MNNRTSFALLAVFLATGAVTASAQAQSYQGHSIDELREEANKMLLADIPLSIWTEVDEYSVSDMIVVTGKVSNPDSVTPVLVKVTNPLSTVAFIDQINPSDIGDDGTFTVQLQASGSGWKYDGIYIVQANYGGVSDTIRLDLSGGLAFEPKFATPDQDPVECGDNEVEASGYCIPYTITGGTVISAFIDTRESSVVISIDAEEDGMITISPSRSVQDGIYFALVDGEEVNDAEIDMAQNRATVKFSVGAEEVRFVSDFVIPEFGAIAAVILAVAITAIIAVSARSRLSIVPRY